jgi:hypothetical protein
VRTHVVTFSAFPAMLLGVCDSNTKLLNITPGSEGRSRPPNPTLAISADSRLTARRQLEEESMRCRSTADLSPVSSKSSLTLLSTGEPLPLQKVGNTSHSTGVFKTGSQKPLDGCLIKPEGKKRYWTEALHSAQLQVTNHTVLLQPR